MDTHDIPVSLSEDCCLGILEFIFSPSIQNVLDRWRSWTIEVEYPVSVAN